MAFSRYSRTNVLDLGRQYGTSRAHEIIRDGIADGSIDFKEEVLHEAQRLDHLAGLHYGDGSYYWIIAAASGIGWALQVPPGTYIRIPNFDAVKRRLA